MVVALLLTASCANTELPADLSGDLVVVTFRPRLYGGLDSKSIGDAGHIDQLRVGDGYWYVSYDNGAIIVIISMFCRV